MNKLRLYHSSNVIIEEPDIKHGRTNADFGQGFYLSKELDFSYKWSNRNSYINVYDLIFDDLKIKEFERNEEWFNYIRNNRINNDIYKDYDVIIGPISNDTIYDTYGILTSNLLSINKVLEILLLGNCYTQVVIKSEKALNNLKYIENFLISEDIFEKYRNEVKKEEKEFHKQFLRKLGRVKNKIM